MNPDTAAKALAVEFAAIAERLTGVPNPTLPPVFTWDIACHGTSLGVGVSPTQVGATGFMVEALLSAPPGAVGVVRPARLPYSGRDYVYDPPTVEAERVAGGVMLRHPGMPGGLPRPPRRLRRRRGGSA